MSAPLADTNVLSELARRQPAPGVLRWAAGLTTIAVSVVTIEEIRCGLAWRPNPRIGAWFQRYLAESCEVLAVTEEVAVRSEPVNKTRAAKRARSTGHCEERSDEAIPTAEIAALAALARDDGWECSGELRGRLRAEGRPRTQADMLIAATAQVHQRVLVTRNLRDFDGCGLALLDPFA